MSASTNFQLPSGLGLFYLFIFFGGGSLLVGSQNSGCSVHIILSQQLHILGSSL